jgi:hypothetical protein
VIGRVTEEHPGKVAMRNAYGVRRVIQVSASDQFPNLLEHRVTGQGAWVKGGQTFNRVLWLV